MVNRSALAVGLLLLTLGPLSGQNKNASPGNPPAILIASQIDADGKLVLVHYHTIFMRPASPKGGGAASWNERYLSRVSLKDVTIYGRDGKKVTVAAARKLLGDKETVILATSWGRQLSPVYRKVFKDHVLVFAFPQEPPTWTVIQLPEAPVEK
jgi:hypothetical protein